MNGSGFSFCQDFGRTSRYGTLFVIDMITWIARIGKVISSMKNDGVIFALRRVALGLWATVRPIARGDVLLISGGTGDSARYRTKHVAEFLKCHGISSQKVFQENIWLSRVMGHARILVFHRPLMTDALGALIERAKKEGKIIIFDTDDVVFDSDIFKKTSAYENMSHAERSVYDVGVGKALLDDPEVKIATCSTPYLAHILREKGKKVFVVPNLLSTQDVNATQNLQSAMPNNTVKDDERERPTFLGYFSGSRSHDRDFATIEMPVARILEEFPEARLCIAGPLVLSEIFAPYADRIERLPFATRKGYFQNLASVDINLAPLEVGDSFCEAKSELKWFEAGAVGVPTVASATETFHNAIQDGVDGCVAQNEEEWYTVLSRLMGDSQLRKNMGEKAREKALNHWTTTADVAQEYRQYIEKILQ